jgi:hypothetical protein
MLKFLIYLSEEYFEFPTSIFIFSISFCLPRYQKYYLIRFGKSSDSDRSLSLEIICYLYTNFQLSLKRFCIFTTILERG